jgi:hypothetical protein
MVVVVAWATLMDKLTPAPLPEGEGESWVSAVRLGPGWC